MWSPDSKKLAFIDQAMRIRIYDTPRGKVTEIDQSPDWIEHRSARSLPFPVVARFALARLCASTKTQQAIFLFDTRPAKLHQATTGYLERHAADLRSRRQVSVLRLRSRIRSGYGTFDNSWTYRTRRNCYRPVARDVKSPLAARNDAENAALDTNAEERRRAKPADKKPDEKKPEEKKPDEEKPDDSKTSANKPQDKPDEEKKRTTAPSRRPTWTSTCRGSKRVPSVLPPKAGNYADLQSIKGKSLPPSTSRRLGRREERHRLLRSRRTRREDGAGRCGHL